MAAGIYNSSFYQGESFNRTFTYIFGGSPGNLTGCTVAMSIRAEKTGLVISLSSYLTIPTPTNGKVVLALPPAFTSTVAVDRYDYDMKFTDASGNVFYWIQGVIDVGGPVTL